MTSLPGDPGIRALDRLTSDCLDLLVIGGGIVGSGVARDAALRGLRVGLVEQHDFAFGTSSRSSRLLHGGLRYLAQYEFGLVREASLEKRILAHIAPHLARPLGFVFPAYRGDGPPLWQLRIGVKLYDLLCSGRNFAPSRVLSLPTTQELLPGLRRAHLRGAVRYFDALTNDARLVIDTLRSAARAGAGVVNYARLVSAERAGSEWKAQVHDRLSGGSASITTRAIVNATGPWSDQLPHSAVRLRLTKGIHLVFDARRIPVPSAVVITSGKRILFVLPWSDRVIIGTTDTDYRGPPEAVTVETADVDYVLRTVNEYFPRVQLTPSDVISAWAGLRPLVANPDGTPSDLSRAHEITSPEPGWWDITGGKLTTYRLMAEQTVDAIVRTLRLKVAPCRTAVELLLSPGDVTPFSCVAQPPCSEEAVGHYVKNEWAVHLSDVILRRSGWHYHERPETLPVDRIATWMAQAAGWSSARRAEEMKAYHTEVSSFAVPPPARPVGVSTP
ncbi:MAG: glycerol-3-phosphate dehydrogenase/oxidase [Opitutaceae bacterium]